MSIDSSECTSQNSNSGGNRAPPPPFSSQTFAQSQRKRPALSNLGIEVSLASDVKTPNTPTPNFANELLDSSDAVLKVRPTPPQPIEAQIQAHHQNQIYNSHQQQDYYIQNEPIRSSYRSHNDGHDEIREPQLSIVLEALSDFQTFYDQKTNRVETLEMHLKHLSDQLQLREAELQSVSMERVANSKILESHKQQLKDLEVKLNYFDKYEGVITTKFENLDILIAEISSTRASYLQKETQLKQRLEDADNRIKDNLKTIKELRIEKETVEIQKETLENENNDRCTEFNGKLYELNSEIKEKNRKIELLSGEREVLVSDLKNITKDRDCIQKECSKALKEVTELAVNSGCESKDLGNLECSISWIKEKFSEFISLKLSDDLEMVNLKQTIHELEKHVASKSIGINEKILEMGKLKYEVDAREQDIKNLQVIIEENRPILVSLEDFKRKIKEIGVPDDFEKIIEKLSQKESEKKLECLTNEISDLKKSHEKELEEQKEEYSLLLREESSKWKIQREDLENEIIKLKRNNQGTNSSNINNKSFSHSQTRPQDADLTAIIKDLKESSDLLCSTTAANTSSSNNKMMGKRTTAGRSNLQSSVYNTNKRRQASTTSSSHNSQKMSSPSSVNSNDIWSLFK